MQATATFNPGICCRPSEDSGLHEDNRKAPNNRKGNRKTRRQEA